MNISRYFVKTDDKGNVVAIGKSDGATYPDMTETDATGYNDAKNKLDNGQG